MSTAESDSNSNLNKKEETTDWGDDDEDVEIETDNDKTTTAIQKDQEATGEAKSHQETENNSQADKVFSKNDLEESTPEINLENADSNTKETQETDKTQNNNLKPEDSMYNF